MKALSRKCTAFLLSLPLLLTLAPTALASEALGDDLDLRSTTLNRGTELGEGTFWSNTFSDLRQENYVVYTPNTSVTPIVTYGDYTTATSTVSAAAKRLEEQGLRVVAGINGDYYDTLNGAPLGTVMTDGVLRVASASNYAVGFRADGTAILGAPALAMQVESANTSFSIAAVNQVRYSYGGIYLYTYDFNARRSTGTNAAGYDVVCSAVDGRLSIGETLTLTVDEILPEATDTAVSEGKYVLTANLLSGEENLALLRALAVGDTLTVTVRAADEGWNDVDYMIGALYQLVENGEVCKGLATGAAPRTARTRNGTAKASAASSIGVVNTRAWCADMGNDCTTAHMAPLPCVAVVAARTALPGAAALTAKAAKPQSATASARFAAARRQSAPTKTVRASTSHI